MITVQQIANTSTWFASFSRRHPHIAEVAVNVARRRCKAFRYRDLTDPDKVWDDEIALMAQVEDDLREELRQDGRVRFIEAILIAIAVKLIVEFILNLIDA